MTVATDYSSQQIGCSCGIVAAKVLVHLKGSGSGFMDEVSQQRTRYATSLNVLHEGNRALDSVHYFTDAFKQTYNFLESAEFLTDYSVEQIMDVMNEGPSLLLSGFDLG